MILLRIHSSILTAQQQQQQGQYGMAGRLETMYTTLYNPILPILPGPPFLLSITDLGASCCGGCCGAPRGHTAVHGSTVGGDDKIREWDQRIG